MLCILGWLVWCCLLKSFVAFWWIRLSLCSPLGPSTTRSQTIHHHYYLLQWKLSNPYSTFAPSHHPSSPLYFNPQPQSVSKSLSPPFPHHEISYPYYYVYYISKKIFYLYRYFSNLYFNWDNLSLLLDCEIDDNDVLFISDYADVNVLLLFVWVDIGVGCFLHLCYVDLLLL